MVSPSPLDAGPGLHANRSAAALIVRVPVPLILIAATLISAVLTAAIVVLAGAAALGRLTIAVAHVLLIAILIPAWSALLPLLILVACLIGHEVPSSSARDRAGAVVAG